MSLSMEYQLPIPASAHLAVADSIHVVLATIMLDLIGVCWLDRRALGALGIGVAGTGLRRTAGKLPDRWERW